ncbi:unnamed protein product [Acidocella sp. C78]|uniref:hypothetical protein n=1 Tax=Acidocella sp. C78 TaxID=1671486 RepID=UPI00191BAF4A|nr:hypothetical protein [Acidocella sp. C78]CAG4926684.1 unnamed protein product [Acidocella sp. C78]
MTRKMTDAQLDYERKRAAKANMSLDEWLKTKERRAAEAASAVAATARPEKKPGLLRRLIDRAHKPI